MRLSSTAEFGEHYILPLLNQFMQLHPNLKVQYAFNSSIEDLINHKLDLAIRLGTLKDSNYRSTKLADYEISLVISPDLLQKFSIKTIDDLSAIPYLANSNLHQSKLSSSSKFNTLLSQLAQDAYFETNTIAALKKMALAHSGMTILPHWYIQQELLEKKLVVLFPDVSLLTQSVNIIFPYSEYIPRKTRLFIDYLKENIQL